MDPVVAPSLDLTSIILFLGVLYGLAVIGLTWFGTRTMSEALVGLGNRFADKRPFLNQVMTIGRFGLWSLGFGIAMLLSLNLSKEVVIALTGTIAVTLGFAFKNLAESIIAGITIILDRPFQVGDRVTFNGSYGEVTAIGLSSVRLLTLDQVTVTIPNNKFLTEAVKSSNWGAVSMLVRTDFFIGADNDFDLVIRLVSDAITSSRYVHVKHPWRVYLQNTITDGYLTMRVRADVHVFDVVFEQELQTDITLRVHDAFKRHGIVPPIRRVDATVAAAS